jgi:hypothetical protein
MACIMGVEAREWCGVGSGEWGVVGDNPPSILYLSASPVDSYGGGAGVGSFYRIDSSCSRDFSRSVGFLSFLKKLKCFFIYFLYVTDASFEITLVHHG